MVTVDLLKRVKKQMILLARDRRLSCYMFQDYFFNSSGLSSALRYAFPNIVSILVVLYTDISVVFVVNFFIQPLQGNGFVPNVRTKE